ncbi:hypothetical protein [Streptococcus pneumoniae]|uniref:hypothetical protein n=1 Tax=Streptococcus pneumoniae TaxID=1313 RepID=UPI0015D9E5A6|nr:hypothetical protein [Streptococcus pneumoniae]
MKDKEQTRKLAAGAQNTVLRLVDKTDEVSHIYNQGDVERGLKRFSKSINRKVERVF